MKISRSHSLGRAEVRTKVQQLADDLGDQYGLVSEWQGHDLSVKGASVRGWVRVSDDEVNVDLKLGFALLMLESTIKSSIKSLMDKHLQ